MHFVERNGNRGRARYAGRMRGLPGPAETVDWELEPWSRLHFWSTPSFWPGILYQFDGLFTCEETAEGTRVRHREAVSLRPPLAVKIHGRGSLDRRAAGGPPSPRPSAESS